MTVFAEGRCACGDVRYRLLDAPIVTHCCHCRWCQRESGSAFALNTVIETDRVEVAQGAPEHAGVDGDYFTFGGHQLTVGSSIWISADGF